MYGIIKIGGSVEENLKKIELFFDYNMKVKKLMYDIAFKEEYIYNQESLIEYEDKVFKALDTIETYLLKILLLFEYSENSIRSLKERFTKYREEFVNMPRNIKELEKKYEKNISYMRKEFTDSINENFAGYYLFSGANVLEPNSINEYLRLLHASIVNNEEVYHKMPEIDSMGEDENSSLHLYGKESEIAYEIFKDFPVRDVRVDILSLSDRILIMARDLGHALMIEITFKNGMYVVNYFIPKVCNYLMVNELKGVTEVKKDSKFAKGVFEAEKDSLKGALYDFLVKVPRDDDMFKEGGLCYKEEVGKTL